MVRISWPLVAAGVAVRFTMTVALDPPSTGGSWQGLSGAGTHEVPPVWTLVKGINAGGDLIGSGGASIGNIDFDFLLERVGAAPN